MRLHKVTEKAVCSERQKFLYKVQVWLHFLPSLCALLKQLQMHILLVANLKKTSSRNVKGGKKVDFSILRSVNNRQWYNPIPPSDGVWRWMASPTPTALPWHFRGLWGARQHSELCELESSPGGLSREGRMGKTMNLKQYKCESSNSYVQTHGSMGLFKLSRTEFHINIKLIFSYFWKLTPGRKYQTKWTHNPSAALHSQNTFGNRPLGELGSEI